jgi:hypothetical protein
MARTRPVVGRSIPRTVVKSAELASTLAPSAASCAVCAPVAGAAEWTSTSMPPVGSTPSTPPRRPVSCAWLSRVAWSAASSAPILAACTRSKVGTFDAAWAAGANACGGSIGAAWAPLAIATNSIGTTNKAPNALRKRLDTLPPRLVDRVLA